METTITVQAAGMVDQPATRCPACHNQIRIERTLDPELGAVSVDELETLVRNEWRRRLGRNSYVRDHSKRLIRALLVYALAPESPIRESIVRQLVWWELTTLGTWGLGRAAVVREFQALAHAVRDALDAAGVDAGLTDWYAAAVQRELRDLLDWPAPGTAPPSATS